MMNSMILVLWCSFLVHRDICRKKRSSSKTLLCRSKTRVTPSHKYIYDILVKKRGILGRILWTHAPFRAKNLSLDPNNWFELKKKKNVIYPPSFLILRHTYFYSGAKIFTERIQNMIKVNIRRNKEVQYLLYIHKRNNFIHNINSVIFQSPQPYLASPPGFPRLKKKNRGVSSKSSIR